MISAAQNACAAASCGCGGHDGSHQRPAVNGIALTAGSEQVDQDTLRERAWSELLRQDAVRQGLLPPRVELEAPALSRDDQRVIEAMLERAVPTVAPSEDECRRFYEARQSRFVEGAQVHARHILFAVTAGVDVRKLVARAEQALLELTGRTADPGGFAQLARELSNCPTGAHGGDLGWFGPHECAPELAGELFSQQNARTVGLRPRLVHSRYGFHIVDVVERRCGRQASFDEVRPRIAALLAQDARAKALHRHMQLLAANASISGVTLAGTNSPLIQ
ncbi:MAG TPA: peptidylprolyl isomerase [Ramlibacter sp.]|nr:peptidylprolyl isomerase [Ramlibacter sp.]